MEDTTTTTSAIAAIALKPNAASDAAAAWRDLPFDERAAVFLRAADLLLDRLADVPTPAGPTPRELGIPATVTMLPIVQIRTGRSS